MSAAVVSAAMHSGPWLGGPHYHWPCHASQGKDFPALADTEASKHGRENPGNSFQDPIPKYLDTYFYMWLMLLPPWRGKVGMRGASHATDSYAVSYGVSFAPSPWPSPVEGEGRKTAENSATNAKCKAMLIVL